MDTIVLHIACEAGDIDIVKNLLGCGVDPRECNEHHETAFHVACKSPKCGLLVVEYSVECMKEKELLHRLFILDVYRDKECRTPLHTAFCCKKRDFAFYLIENDYCSLLQLTKLMRRHCI